MGRDAFSSCEASTRVPHRSGACASTDGLPTEAQLQGWLDGTILGFQDEAEVTVRLVDDWLVRNRRKG